MGDVDGPLVARTVYKELFKGDSPQLDMDAVPYALDAAVTEMRNCGLHVTRWAPYIHLGI
jgi:hypothetical protein